VRGSVWLFINRCCSELVIKLSYDLTVAPFQVFYVNCMAIHVYVILYLFISDRLHICNLSKDSHLSDAHTNVVCKW